MWENMLRHAGTVVTDGLLITGQNPASSEPAAKALLAKLSLLSLAINLLRTMPSGISVNSET